MLTACAPPSLPSRPPPPQGKLACVLMSSPGTRRSRTLSQCLLTQVDLFLSQHFYLFCFAGIVQLEDFQNMVERCAYGKAPAVLVPHAGGGVHDPVDICNSSVEAAK